MGHSGSFPGVAMVGEMEKNIDLDTQASWEDGLEGVL